jgi:RimJ/RimL family protein N-acetyltransferase
MIEITRKYRILKNNRFSYNEYELVPIRDDDKEFIRVWRNEQIDILRQNKILSVEDQEKYFSEVVAHLFDQSQPKQLLFSFFCKEELIGYGGLVHIDWEKGEAELSFLTETTRNKVANVFINDWKNYLYLIRLVAFKELSIERIFTYAYDLRPNLYVALEASGFHLTERIKNAVVVNNESKDVCIHSFLKNDIWFRNASAGDVDLYYAWANDPDVRNFSFSTDVIEYDSHVMWFQKRLNTPTCKLFIFLNAVNEPIGQVRIEMSGTTAVIGISIDKDVRGKGFSARMLKMATKEFTMNFSNIPIYAYIKKENTASVRSFEAAGYTINGEGVVGETKCLVYKYSCNERN